MIIKTNLIKVKIKLPNKGTIKVDHRNITRANDHISGLNVFVFFSINLVSSDLSLPFLFPGWLFNISVIFAYEL